MRARAPGKVVLSGAYAVLRGAPAIVAAVDRYVVADSTQLGEILTDEVKAAGLSTPIWFDASRLRSDGKKLGLGSSAAILAATLGAHELARSPDLSRRQLADRVFPVALAAHRLAQGGGSGIDVAASCYGGILHFCLVEGAPLLSPLAQPNGLCIEIWASTVAASTQSMLAAVRAFGQRDRLSHDRDLYAQSAAAEQTARAWQEAGWSQVIAGLVAQRHALERLGVDAQIPIVTRELAALADLAERHGSAVLPAGAGGGDVALFVGPNSSLFMQEALTQSGHLRIPITLGVTGLDREPEET